MKNKVKITEKIYDLSFTSFGYLPETNSLYCLSRDDNILQIYCDEFTARYIYPNTNITGLSNYVAYESIAVHKKVLFFHYSGYEYLVYDVENNSIDSVILSDGEAISSVGRPNLIFCSLIDEVVICFLRNTNEIIKINPMSNVIVERTKLQFSIEKAYVVLADGLIYMFFDNTRDIKAIDPVSNKVMEFKIEKRIDSLQDIFFDGEQFYLLTSTGKILITDLRGKFISYDINCNENDFSTIVKAGKRIWVFPALGDDIYYIENNKLSLYEEYDEDFQYGAEKKWFLIGSKYYNYVRIKNGFCFPARVGNKLAFIDDSGRLTWKKIAFKDLDLELNVRMNMFGHVNENIIKGCLKNFINII